MKIDRFSPNSAILKELGTRLQRARKQRGLTQDALAEEAGLGVATLRRIEDGNDGKLGSWLRLLKALDRTAAIDALLPEEWRSPMAEVRAQGGARGGPRDGGFVWGDERR